jgi:hypothetical protein
MRDALLFDAGYRRVQAGAQHFIVIEIISTANNLWLIEIITRF